MKKLIFLLILFSIFLYGIKFNEKIDSKYIDTINYLLDKGILKGFPDGTFKVNWAISQSEFITLIVRCNIKFEKRVSNKNIYENAKLFIMGLYRMFMKKDNKIKFYDFQNEWFHPFLIEYLKISDLNENEIEPFSYINIYDALYLLIKASIYKGEIQHINLPLDDKEKREVLISAVSHKFYPSGLPFNNKLSRGDAFILIENYLRRLENAFNN
ncbi:MAG: S-layer homology domain-containing protein [Caldisericia bacterium]|nr:S-layer homology domain-containing protein [Caldisericia bacterium]